MFFQFVARLADAAAMSSTPMLRCRLSRKNCSMARTSGSEWVRLSVLARSSIPRGGISPGVLGGGSPAISRFSRAAPS
jgi:hypothetical protein